MDMVGERSRPPGPGGRGRMDDTAWLISREIPHLRRFALALLRDPDAADDLVQDTLERALRKQHLWRRRGSIRNWLFRVLYNVFVNGQNRRRRVRLEGPLEDAGAALAHPARQERQVECRDMAEALEQLPKRQKAAIVLVALEGVSYDEAADILGVPVGTVRSTLSRGRETLRELNAGKIGRTALRRVK